MRNEFDSYIKDLLKNEISYKNRESYLENSLIYKIMENQEMCPKESFFSDFEEGEIFERIVEKINFEEFQNVKTLLFGNIFINILSKTLRDTL